MSRTRLVQIGGAILLLALLAWGVTAGLRRMVAPDPAPSMPAEPAPPPATARIEATLFYGSPDGQALVPVRREVALADDVLGQGRQILIEQLRGAPAPYVSVIPEGTTLRAFYVTERGEAFVDLSADVTTAHPGGSMTELLTVYAIVNAVTANLPAISRVQLLVDGREVETIAGHVDVRRPLTRDLTLVRDP